MRNLIHVSVPRKVIFVTLVLILLIPAGTFAQTKKTQPAMRYTVSMLKAATHYCHVELETKDWDRDSLHFKMPQWTPGYYQIMNYADAVENISARDERGKNIPLKKLSNNTWSLGSIRNKTFKLSYDIKTERQFVATSYIDTARAYLVPASIFLYVDGFISTPVTVKVEPQQTWTKFATGLDPVAGKPNEFTAPDFDILYDCPILIGNLEELPSFQVNEIDHRFLGYDMGSFDHAAFMANLKKVVQSASAIIGDIPYKRYTFIAIGKTRGGIEHLNNTTIGFDGSGLAAPEAMNSMMNFLAHEYFHHYNVKRIRPYELGPFNYDQGTKTNLLWVSEGLSVYYEYLIVKRAGLIDERTLLADFEHDINALENNPGRLHQSLAQSSYATWSDGPFATQGKDPGKAISYYIKGPVVGLILDFAIRNATQNKKSLDDVMRYVYWEYYKNQQRGFTDAEFQQACEVVAGTPLTHVFEYVYTTKELDYALYLGYAGLQLERSVNDKNQVRVTLKRIEKMNAEQRSILESWLSK